MLTGKGNLAPRIHLDVSLKGLCPRKSKRTEGGKEEIGERRLYGTRIMNKTFFLPFSHSLIPSFRSLKRT